MSTPANQVFVGVTQTNVITVVSPGPQGPTGPIGIGVQGPTGPATAAFSNSVTQTLAAGPLNNLGAATLIGLVGGFTNRLLLTPASGGTTITGFDATGYPDGFSILWVNQSATDSFTFSHLGGGSLSGNQFSNANGAPATLAPLATAVCRYTVNKWKFG